MIRIVKAGERGVDFSFARPPAARLVELGYTFVVGYISVPPASPKKNITKAECEAYLAAGLAVLLVWEMSGSTASLGGAVGALHGAEAEVEARNRGYPTDVPLLVADDSSTTAANIDAKQAYMTEFDKRRAGIGIYGGVKTLTPCVGLWLIGWVPVSAWSWSVNLTRLPDETTADYNTRGRAAAAAAARDVGAHVLQEASYYLDNTWAVDPNEAIADFPAWSTTTDTPQPTTPGGDDMAFIRNQEPRDGYPPDVIKMAVMADGHWRHVTETELKALGVANSTALGTPMSNAELDELGEWTPTAAGALPLDFTAPVNLSISLSGGASGTIGKGGG